MVKSQSNPRSADLRRNTGAESDLLSEKGGKPAPAPAVKYLMVINGFRRDWTGVTGGC